MPPYNAVATEEVRGADFYHNYRQMIAWTDEAIDGIASLGVDDSRVSMDIGLFSRLSLSVDRYEVHGVELRAPVADSLSKVRRWYREKWRERIRIHDAYYLIVRDLPKVPFGFDLIARRMVDALPREARPIAVSPHPPDRRIVIHAFDIDTVPDL